MLRLIALLLLAVPCLPATVSVKDKCSSLQSCSSCLQQQACMWCVTKSRCSSAPCANGNLIYPIEKIALMAGPEFCPRIIPVKKATFRSGEKSAIKVKLTQIYVYMAFTSWECRIYLGRKEITVKAVLQGGNVLCEATLLENEPGRAHEDGSVTVTWERSKTLDGSLPIRVCRCEVDPHCRACKK